MILASSPLICITATCPGNVQLIAVVLNVLTRFDLARFVGMVLVVLQSTLRIEHVIVEGFRGIIVRGRVNFYAMHVITGNQGN